jgi:hypothetical protein
VRINLKYLAGSLQSIEARHAYIENNNVRLELLGFVHGFSSIRRFAADLPVSLGLQQRNQALSHDFVIVSYQNAEDCHNFTSPRPNPWSHHKSGS